MLTFLFWNLNGQPLEEVVSALAQRHQIDVLLLSECAIAPAILLRALNSPNAKSGTLYRYARLEDREKVHIIIKEPLKFSLIPRSRDENGRLQRDFRWTIGELQQPGHEKITLVAVHLPDARNTDFDGRASMCRRLADEIRRIEGKHVKHRRTLVAGDFNLQPFDKPMLDADVMHGVMSRRVAEDGERISNGRSLPFFYNPMWNFFGDLDGPPATYYYRSSKSHEYFWYMFDQILVRPPLLERFNARNVSILTECGSTRFLDEAGHPDKTISDHLPVLWSLDG